MQQEQDATRVASPTGSQFLSALACFARSTYVEKFYYTLRRPETNRLVGQVKKWIGL